MEFHDRIGIDVGGRSLGFAAVQYDRDNRPHALLHAVSVIHDGGGDRKKDANAAARTRRRYARSAKRVKDLDRMLDGFGYPRPGKQSRLHSEWRRRSAAATAYIPNEPERLLFVASAIRHIAQHPGWQNPWGSYESLAEAARPGFTEEHLSWCERWMTPGDDADDKRCALQEHLSRTFSGRSSEPTIGEMVWAALRHDKTLNIRPKAPRKQASKIKPSRRKPKAPKPGFLDGKTFAQDTLAEWFRICERQHVPDEHRDTIARLVFSRESPTIPAESVGRCTLTGEPRSPKGAIEFEEYRAVQALANLRVRESGGQRRLTAEEFDQAVALLMDHPESEPLEWIDVEDALNLVIGSIVAPTVLDESGERVVRTAPTFRTGRVVGAYLNRKSEDKTTTDQEEWERLAKWWQTNPSGDEQREFAAVLADTTASPEALVADGAPVSPAVIAALTDSENGPDVGRQGRAAFSRSACKMLAAHVREHRCDLTTAIKAVYGVDSWSPPLPTWDEKTGHPVVDAVVGIVRSQVVSLVRELDRLPEEVAIEFARDAALAPEAHFKALGQQAAHHNRNRETERLIREHLADKQGKPINEIDATVSREQRIRWEKIVAQDSRCLYCGTSIDMLTSELDHIMPASKGGSNRRENKVAVCKPCNATKNNAPFPVFLSTQYAKDRGLTLDVVLERVQDVSHNLYPDRGKGSAKSRGIYVSRVRARLNATEYDQFDERALASTGFAAVHVRGVLTRWLQEEAARRGVEPTKVCVYTGTAVAAARQITGINRVLTNKDAKTFRDVAGKSRLDRRHHAVDAITLTALSPVIAQVLTIRENIRRAEAERGIYRKHPECTWPTYEGDDWPQMTTFRDWKGSMKALPCLISDGLSHLAVVEPRGPVTKVGPRHEANPVPVERIPLGAEWPLAKIERIADFDIRQALLAMTGPNGLPSDTSRALALSGRSIIADQPIAVFPPGSGPMLLVRGGAVGVGDTVRASRVVAWRIKNGGIRFGLVRLYSAELDLLGWDKNTSPLTGPLPPESQAMRTLHPAVAKAIAAGQAATLGLLRLPTEVRFCLDQPTKIQFVDRFNTAAKAHGWRREEAWQIRGFNDPERASLGLLYLAREGLASKGNGDMPEAMRKPILTSQQVRINTLLGCPVATIVERDHTGRIVREWNPLCEAERLL